MIGIEESYRHCERIARARAKNFYYSFLLLPKHKRLAMCAVYAFMRRCDDLSDEDGASVDGLTAWRIELDHALAGKSVSDPLWPAFVDTARRFRIPSKYFHEMIDGVSSDFERKQFETFSALYGYCYLVASVVGLTIIHIFEFEDQRALELAEKCGIAFQLTNILRDVKEDHDNGRVYLPQEDLRRFGVQTFDAQSSAVRSLLRFEVDRARAYYRESGPLVAMVHADSRAALWALIEIYRRLLDRIDAAGTEVLTTRIRLSTFEKLGILAQATLQKR